MRTWSVLNNFGQPTGTIVETGNMYTSYDLNGVPTGSAVKMGNMTIQYSIFGLPERTLVEVTNTDLTDFSLPDPINFFNLK